MIINLIISKALQIIGALLLASSLIGEERLKNSEIMLRAFFETKRVIKTLMIKLNSLRESIRKLLLIPLILIFLSIIVIAKGKELLSYIYFIIYGTYSLSSGQEINMPAGFCSVFLRSLCAGDMIFEVLLLFFLWPLFLFTIWAPAIFFAEITAKLLAILFYLFLLFPTALIYLLTVTVLSPYAIFDHIAQRMKLRSSLGFTGLILTIIGICIPN